MLTLIREHGRFFLAGTVAALALRLFFFFYFPVITDDSRVYADLATNWLQHGVYGQGEASPAPTQAGPTLEGQHAQSKVQPTDARLPGYPAFLAVIFWVFGAGNFRAVMLAQIVIDLGTCLIIADMARRMVSERAGRTAFVLAGLCPFLANYAVAELTETLEIFFTALALDCAIAALNRMRAGVTGLSVNKLWAAAGAAIAGCILLRPDGGIVLAAVLLYMAVDFAGLLRRGAKRHADRDIETRQHRGFEFFGNTLIAGIIVSVFALAPLVPWTIRNARTLHHFQPLAPRYANETDELVLRGFNRWVKTWIVDYVSVEEIYWNVPGDKIDAQKLPSRALENPEERDATLAVIDDYNEDQDMTQERDAQLGEIAGDRIRAHPFRYYAELPLLRVADMWLRPRTELLPPDPRWWEFNDDVKHSITAVGFGVLNLIYVVAAAWALARRASGIRWSGMLVSFLLLRSALLITLENPEPRYTLECYPAIIVLASSLVAGRDRRDREAC